MAMNQTNQPAQLAQNLFPSNKDWQDCKPHHPMERESQLNWQQAIPLESMNWSGATNNILAASVLGENMDLSTLNAPIEAHNHTLSPMSDAMGSNKNQELRTGMNTPEANTKTRQSEKRRRDSENKNFQTLCNLLPHDIDPLTQSLGGRRRHARARETKIHLVQRTIYYVKQLQQDLDSSTTDFKRLLAENSQLRQRFDNIIGSCCQTPMADDQWATSAPISDWFKE